MFYKYLFCIYKCLFCKCCALVFVLNTVWPFSGYSSQDCEKTGISCLTMHCNLSALAKEESRTIDIYMLLNTEILKKVSPEELYSQSSFKTFELVSSGKTLPAPFKTVLASTTGNSASEECQGNMPDPCYSKCGPRTSSVSITWELLRPENPGLHSGLTKSASLFKQEPQMFCLCSCFLGFFFNIYFLFICLCQVLVAARGS